MTFRIALTGDFFQSTGELRFKEIGLDLARNTPGIDVVPFQEHRPEIAPEQIGTANGVLVLAAQTTAFSVSQADHLLVMARFGVGYDNVDVAALTANDVVLTIAAGAVDRPVAEATLGWMIALSHHMLVKDKLVREANWQIRSNYMGTELRGKTMGIIGFGGIGRALMKLLAGFGMRQVLAFDPFVSPEAARQAGAQAVSLPELLQQADFVSIHCPLNEQTKNLLGAAELRAMKPTAYLINTARGGIVHEGALFEALQQRWIAGAAIDCFVGEPLTEPPPLAQLDNVILAPHCIAWTDELYADVGQMALQGMIDLAHGKRPHGVVNPMVFDRPGFQAKWRRLRLPPG